MAEPRLEYAKVALPAWLLPRWIKVAYKLPPRDLGDIFKTEISPKAYAVLSKSLEDFINKGIEPDKAITQVVHNLADDYVNNREMTLKAGDYVALINYMRNANLV